MMATFVYILVSLLMSVTNAELPEYLKPCNHSDPNICQCLIDSVHCAVEELKDGYPGTDIPSLDPFVINKIKQDLKVFSFKINFVMKELCISNLTSFNITNMAVDGYEYKMEILFPKVRLQGNFILNLRFGQKIIENVNGIGKGILENLKASIVLKGKVIKVNKNDSLEFDEMSVKLSMEKSNGAVKIKGYESIEKIINVGLDKNSYRNNIIFEATRGDMEKIVETKLLSIIKEITFGYPISELFPH